MTDTLTQIVLEMAAEIRDGADAETIIPEFAAEYGVKVEAVRARFYRAYPAGVTAAAPSEEEMLRRRREENQKIRDENERMARGILEFFAQRPELKLEVRRNIYRYTGKQSCSLATAKQIADRLTK